MKPTKSKKTEANLHSETILGVVYASTAFLIWGISPIYWKELIEPEEAWAVSSAPRFMIVSGFWDGLADPMRLRQFMVNLVGNAIKFTPEGGRVSVVARKETQGAIESVLFTVEDTGVGIPQDCLHTIFESFRQVEGRSDGEREGTGLGLAISRWLVELHGGRIWVESEGMGRGATFKFTMPVT